MSIYQWDTFLTEEEIKIVDEEMQKGKWVHGAHEKIFPEERKFWGMDLTFSSPLIRLMETKMENFLGKKIVGNLIYANAQAHGQSAWVHTDVSPDSVGNYSTLIYYVHKDWRPEYGGHLIFIDGNTIKDKTPRVIASVFPSSNSAVLIDSKSYHMALEPSVYCKEQRISIAFKFKVED